MHMCITCRNCISSWKVELDILRKNFWFLNFFTSELMLTCSADTTSLSSCSSDWWVEPITMENLSRNDSAIEIRRIHLVLWDKHVCRLEKESTVCIQQHAVSSVAVTKLRVCTLHSTWGAYKTSKNCLKAEYVCYYSCMYLFLNALRQWGPSKHEQILGTGPELAPPCELHCNPHRIDSACNSNMDTNTE